MKCVCCKNKPECKFVKYHKIKVSLEEGMIEVVVEAYICPECNMEYLCDEETILDVAKQLDDKLEEKKNGEE